MASIGKVTIAPTGQQTTVRIRQAAQTTIATPNFETKANLSLDDLFDVETTNVQDGYTITYNSTSQKYQAGPRANVDSIVGGTF